MTAITLRAVLAEVPVVFTVTDRTLLRHFDRARRLVMTGGTLQLRVRSQQWEVSFLGMIEDPQRPPIRRMAALAFLAEPAFVHIIVRMTIDARSRRLAEGERRMTLRTADDAVQAEQWKIGQVMIE